MRVLRAKEKKNRDSTKSVGLEFLLSLLFAFCVLLLWILPFALGFLFGIETLHTNAFFCPFLFASRRGIWELGFEEEFRAYLCLGYVSKPFIVHDAFLITD